MRYNSFMIEEQVYQVYCQNSDNQTVYMTRYVVTGRTDSIELKCAIEDIDK